MSSLLDQRSPSDVMTVRLHGPSTVP